MDLKLTPSQENYLEHIWHLSGKGSIRSVDIAGSVGVKRPSVTRAVNNLASLGLVKHEHYRGIEFTKKGFRAAQFIVHRDRCLKRFLTIVLQLDPKSADDEVCRMEHAVSAEVMQRIDVLTNCIDEHTGLKKELGRKLNRSRNPKKEPTAVSLSAKPHV